MTDQLRFYQAMSITKGRDMSELNIYQRINKVMQSVKYVQKDRQVTGGGQNYKAVTHDQVVAVARQELVKNGIMIYPEQLQSRMIQERDLQREIKMHLYSGDYAIHFVNIDKPDDRVTVTINAHAADNGDKAPGKAVTYATKTAILKVLCLETGENDESRAKDTETISSEQADKLVELAKQSGNTEQDVCRTAKVEFIGEILASNYQMLAAHFERQANQPKEKITDDRLQKAIERIKSGEYTLAKLHAKFELTEDQNKKVNAEVAAK
jgi:hypothetical protein